MTGRPGRSRIRGSQGAIESRRRDAFTGKSIAEHAQIIKALEEGDVARAARAVEHHRMGAMERLAGTT